MTGQVTFGVDGDVVDVVREARDPVQQPQRDPSLWHWGPNDPFIGHHVQVDPATWPETRCAEEGCSDTFANPFPRTFNRCLGHHDPDNPGHFRGGARPA